MEELVTIVECNNVNEAYLLKSRLEHAGIRTFVQNENINSILPMGGLGGIKVQVNLRDSFKAMDVLYDEEKEL